MAIHHPTLPFSGGERPRLPSAQVGPVTQAIRRMRSAEPTKVGRASPTFGRSAFSHGIHTLSRTEVEDLIGGLIDLLDAMDGDTDREHEEPEASSAEWLGRGAHRFNVGEAA